MGAQGLSEKGCARCALVLFNFSRAGSTCDVRFRAKIAVANAICHLHVVSPQETVERTAAANADRTKVGLAKVKKLDIEFNCCVSMGGS
jgi:hypothetical protein